MDRTNLLCEAANCGKSARVFGLKGNLKSRSCEGHIPSLLDKGMPIHEIAGYQFINTPIDAVEFESRKTQVEKVRGVLGVLETNCESELESALRDIGEVKSNVMREVECRLEEIKIVVIGVSKETKKQISLLRDETDRYLTSKENELLHTAVLLSAPISNIPRLLRFGIADMSDRISATLSESWTIATADINLTLNRFDENQKNDSIRNALVEAANWAQKGMPNSLQDVDLLIGDGVEFEEEKSKVLLNLLEFEKKKEELKGKWLQQFWDFRQQHLFSEQTTIGLGKKFAKILYCKLGRHSEADKILRYCYDIVKIENPVSEESMSLCNEMCGVYFASGQYLQVEQIGMWILTTFETANHSAEHYWATLLYLTYSMREMSKNEEATAILENWKRRVFQKENKLSEMYQNITSGIESYYRENQEEAVRYLGQARRIGINHFPTSPFTALSIYFFALTSGGSAEEQLYLQAHSIYDVAAPTSIQAANTLYELGCFFTRKSHRNDKTAINYFRQAQAIYEVAAPMAMKAAYNFSKLGNSLTQDDQKSEALQCYQKTQYILKENGLKSDLTISNLLDLGQVYHDLGYINEAIESFQQVHDTLEVNANTWPTAVDNLRKLANVLSKDRDRSYISIGCYQQAQVIMERFDPKSDLLPDNYMDIAKVFEERGDISGAIDCYQKAAVVYGEKGNQPWKKRAETKIAELQNGAGRI